MNARLELLKEPQKQQAAMATLDLAARFTQSDRAVPLLLQAVLFFLQKGGDEQRQVQKRKMAVALSSSYNDR